MISGANEEQLELANARADILLLQQENKKYKEVIDKLNECIVELSDNTDDTTCYEIDKDCKNDLLDILKEVE